MRTRASVQSHEEATMTAPVPEEGPHEPLGLTEEPADEHPSEAPDADDASPADEAEQQRNAETSEDQPSQ